MSDPNQNGDAHDVFRYDGFVNCYTERDPAAVWNTVRLTVQTPDRGRFIRRIRLTMCLNKPEDPVTHAYRLWYAKSHLMARLTSDSRGVSTVRVTCCAGTCL